MFVSVKGRHIGGGANTFASNFSDWVKCRSEGLVLERKLARADLAIVIADKVNEKELSRAKSNGCFVIHRLDEHVEEDQLRGKIARGAPDRAVSNVARPEPCEHNHPYEDDETAAPEVVSELFVEDGCHQSSQFGLR